MSDVEYYPRRLHFLKRIPRVRITTEKPAEPTTFELIIRTDTDELEFAPVHGAVCKVKLVEIVTSEPLPRIQQRRYEEV
ncbi:MAG: hypothetical protein ACXQTZ_05070 [Candidatus Alkanophagales archaeon]